jgi:hypothetical protein
LSWDPPVDDGATEILGYLLEANNVDTASGWYEVYDGRSSPLVTQFKLQEGLVAGQYYEFRTSARNIKGWSPVSDSRLVLVATVPDAMAAPERISVTIADPTAVTIGWTTPSTQEEGGSPVLGFRIWRNYGYNTTINSATEVEIMSPTDTSYTY